MVAKIHTELSLYLSHMQPAAICCCCWSLASDVVIILLVASKLSPLGRTLIITVTTAIPITAVTRTTRNTASSTPPP